MEQHFLHLVGAASHDISDGILEIGNPRIKEWSKNPNKMFRVNHKSWWKEELPSEEEMQEGICNLDYVGNKVDFILTHCASSSTAALLSHGLYKSDTLTNYFEKLKVRLNLKNGYLDIIITTKQLMTKRFYYMIRL